MVVVTVEKEGRRIWTRTLSRRRLVSGLSWGEIRKGEREVIAYYFHEAEQRDLVMKNVGDKDEQTELEGWDELSVEPSRKHAT